MLEATYQVDHTVALMNGGTDNVNNMTAMCVSCHAKKTQLEHVVRSQREVQPTVEEYISDDREDVVCFDGRLLKCTVCGNLRPKHSSWESHKCPGRQVSQNVYELLRQYEYSPK